jgi:hypothetical protein|nr:MAG TPA: hypothetical protein [Caudoviricetes sp.]
MKVLKVYGAPGLQEWTLVLGNGPRLHLHFEHGSQNAFGASPAEYRTDNKFFQTIIEQSNYFKEGRIVLLDEVVLEGEEDDNAVSSVAESEEQASEAQEEAQPKLAMKMSFPSVDDAREYAVEKLGVAASSVRSRAALEKALSDAGVVFEIQ